MVTRAADDVSDYDDKSINSSHVGGGGYSSAEDMSVNSGSIYSTTTGTMSHTNSSGLPGLDPFEDDIMTRRETRAVVYSKALVLFVLLGSATLAGVVTWIYTTRGEYNDFITQFEDFSYEIAEVSYVNAADVYGLIESFSSTATSFALSTESEWPYVTIPHIEIRGSRFLNVSGSHSVSIAPIVTDLDGWNKYSVLNQDWISESYMLSGNDDIPDPIPDQVFLKTDEGVPIPEVQQPGVEYTPLWQEAHAPLDTSIINHDLYSDELFHKIFDFARITNSAVLSPVFDPSALLGRESLLSFADDLFHPESILVQPVYDSFEKRNRKVVAAAIAVLGWDTYFKKLLHKGANGIVCVLEDTCGDQFTYEIHGPEATFLGAGDLHDTIYDDLEFVADFAPFVDFTDAPESDVDAHCEYSLHIYPSQELQASYETNRPAIFTAAVVLVFLFTSIVFLLYDMLVQRRQRKVHTAAVKSNAIVSSLFPAEIRERLFQHNEEPEQNPNNKKAKNNIFDSAPNKFRLKNYLDDGDSDSNKGEEEKDEKNTKGSDSDENGSAQPDMLESKPIADLFPNTTVMFADIAGFTAWSSVREPSQVFTLLETVYRAFDVIAKRRRVFKVETVGDCYVAVTGLPEPRKDHALIMARFARDSMHKMNELSHQLEVTLGPDTGDLAMRFGLHSGPVTAGVLRGDKSRFQLFGDTVNTAARIESTGQRNRIHVSEETARLIEAGGKVHWLRARTDLVHAKGKGEMKTFWLLTKDDKAKDPSKDLNDSHDSGLAHEADKNKNGLVQKAGQVPDAMPAPFEIPQQTQVSPKLNRLVEWNVDVLQRLLKLIVSKRSSSQSNNHKQSEDIVDQMEQTIGSNGMVLDEVAEIVALPKFDDRNHKRQLNPNEITIPPLVLAQLRDYVRSIATMYRDNPFHNFEHASHVTMSVSKLLSRIVAPDIDQEDKNLASNLHDHTYGITSDPLTQFAVVLSALIHDVDHVGVPNFLLIGENSSLATRYKNKSVAEQNSVDIAWERLMEPRFSALRYCIYHGETELKRFRQLLVNTVLATDIFDKELQALRKNRWEKAFKIKNCVTNKQEDINRKATIVIEHLIQASDVAHTMQHWHIYQKWNERLFKEMYSAYRMGRSSKDPTSGWYQGELGFFDNYIIPLAKKLKDCGVFGVSSDEYLNYALENRREWAAKGEAVVQSMADKYVEKPEPLEQHTGPVETPVVSTTPKDSKKDNGGSTTQSTAPTEQSSSTSQESAADSINPANASPYDNADH